MGPGARPIDFVLQEPVPTPPQAIAPPPRECTKGARMTRADTDRTKTSSWQRRFSCTRTVRSFSRRRP
jgi:hypothetical protein